MIKLLPIWGDDVPDGLGQDHVEHGLDVGHADGLGPLGLARVHGDDAAPDGFRHISAGVDGDHDDGHRPDVGPLDGVVREVGQAEEDEHRLEDHGGAPEDLHIGPQDDPDDLQDGPLGQGVVFRGGDGLQNAADEADEAADHRADHGQDQGVGDAVPVLPAVLAPKGGNIHPQLGQLFHGGSHSFS